MKEKVLVTGAYGLLGSHTVRELIRNGYHVRAFGRDPEKLKEKSTVTFNVKTGSKE